MNMYPPTGFSPAWTARTKRIVALIVLIIIGLVLLRFSETVPIVAVSAILAYLLTPLVNHIDQKILVFGPFADKPHRGLAVLLGYIVVLLFIVIVILVVVPTLLNQFEEFGSRVPPLLQNLGSSLERTLKEPLTFNGEPIVIGGEPFVPLERLREITGTPPGQDVIRLQDLNLVGATQTFIGSLTGSAFNFVGGALTALINIIFMLSMTFYLLRDGALFIARMENLTPSLYRNDVRRMLYELGQVWNAYLRGQMSLALIMGITVFIVATLLGVPNPPILGLISSLLEFIPSIGPGLAIFPAALLALSSPSATLPFLEGAPFAIIVIIVWAALQNIEAIILVPRVMGGSLNLHPLIVIIAVLAGASLAGLLGIILAAPTVASLRVFGQYIYGKLLDKDPFPVYKPQRSKVAPRAVMVQRLWTPVNERLGVIRGRFAQQVRDWMEARSKHDHA